MAANTTDTGESAPFIVPDEKLYFREVMEIEDIRKKLSHLKLIIQSEESNTTDPEAGFANPAFTSASASTDSLTASINNLTLYEKKELRADLELRLSQLLTIVTKDKKNPAVIEEENLIREIEMQKKEDEALDRQYHRGMKWTIGIAVGFGLMCIMVPATALLLVQKGVI
ncbi:hypothetical protein H072_3390 [Dactylellina haptotyla CBS 200.50]|uniref:Uncharacterized protein n=1 Tax=Dactylellina haptotyla (strain CBS 200.50) TaxID=1284197 RepID=S8C4L1_DACHA|nr:hypothetical protein H072_3390 [Dactylellina haptotyla CBS 200.50]